MSDPSKNPRIDMSLTAHDQAVRLMASWIAAIADQVKNPVAGISAAAGLIERQMSSFRAAQSWDPAIVEEAVRLMLERLRTFDNYLAELSGFTRPVEVQVAAIDLKSEWNGIEQAISKKINQTFDLRLNLSGVGVVYADLERLKAVLTAIVLNAVESCGARINPEIVVACSAFETSAELPGVLLKIFDNGPGFSEAALIQGLVPFYTTKEAGTGLGLAMVEKYMRAHGGWVKIDNNAGGGAVVSLFFPDPPAMNSQG